MRALATRFLTVDDFLHRYTGIEGRWELVHGVPVMMAGGTIHHGRIARNIVIALGTKLCGRGVGPSAPTGALRLILASSALRRGPAPVIALENAR